MTAAWTADDYAEFEADLAGVRAKRGFIEAAPVVDETNRRAYLEALEREEGELVALLADKP